MAWCLLIFVAIMAVPGLSRFIDYSGHSFPTHPIPHQYISHLYPLEQSIQLSDISPSYLPAYPQQVTHVYTPPENTYRGFTYQTLDIYGGISQVGFMTGSEANSLLEDSFKTLGNVKILVPKLTLDKTPDSKENVGLNTKTENKLQPETETKSALSEQSVAVPTKTQDTPLASSGFFFPPIQVNHFQAGASYIVPPFFNAQQNFPQEFGLNSMAEIPDTIKATEEVATTNDNGSRMANVPINNEAKPDLSEPTEGSRSIENVLTEDTSTSPSTEDQNVSNESSTVKDNNISSPSDNISNEESSTVLSTDNESTAKIEDSSATDQPQSEENENVSNPSSITGEDEATSTNKSETTPNPTDSSLEENATTENSE